MLNLNRDKLLLKMIESYLNRKIDLPLFETSFIDQYLDSNGVIPIDDSLKEFFDTVVEKSSWTATTPTDFERSVGWIDESAFRSWLRGQLELVEERIDYR